VPSKLEATIKACHAAIRKDPIKKPNPKKTAAPKAGKRKLYRQQGLSLEQRKGRIKQKFLYQQYKKTHAEE